MRDAITGSEDRHFVDESVNGDFHVSFNEEELDPGVGRVVLAEDANLNNSSIILQANSGVTSSVNVLERCPGTCSQRILSLETRQLGQSFF